MTNNIKVGSVSAVPMTAGIYVALAVGAGGLYMVNLDAYTGAVALASHSVLLAILVLLGIAINERPRVRWQLVAGALIMSVLVPFARLLADLPDTVPLALTYPLLAIAAVPAGLLLSLPDGERNQLSRLMYITPVPLLAVVVVRLANVRAYETLPLDLTSAALAVAGVSAVVAALTAGRREWALRLVPVSCLIGCVAFSFGPSRISPSLFVECMLPTTLLWTLGAGVRAWRHDKDEQTAHLPPELPDRASPLIRLLAGCAAGLVLLSMAARFLPANAESLLASPSVFPGRTDLDDLLVLLSIAGALTALIMSLREFSSRTVAVALLIPAFALWLPCGLVSPPGGEVAHILVLVVLGAVALFTMGAVAIWAVHPDSARASRLIAVGSVMICVVFAASMSDGINKPIAGIGAFPVWTLVAAALVGISAVSAQKRGASHRLRIATTVLFAVALVLMVYRANVVSPWPGANRQMWGYPETDASPLAMMWCAGMALLVIAGSAAAVHHLDEIKRAQSAPPFVAVADLDDVPDMSPFVEGAPAKPEAQHMGGDAEEVGGGPA